MSVYDDATGDWYEESPNFSVVTTDTDKDVDPGLFPTVVPTRQAENCSLPSPFFQASDYNSVTAAICALYFMFGIFCAFFGYRCFKAIMFLTGFIFGSILVYLICLEENVLPMWSNTLIAVCAGVLFGLITLLVQYVGLFMLGFHGGLLLGIVGLCAAEPWITPSSPWVSVGVLLLTGLFFSLCNLYFQKTFTIFCSAFYGGAVMATGLDFFVENSVMLLWVWDRVRVKESEQPCWFSWAILATWPLTLFLGIITQILVTGQGIYHEEQFPQRKHRLKNETREERKQRKYKYLYQIRTCHGDVISQPIADKYIHQIDESQA